MSHQGTYRPRTSKSLVISDSNYWRLPMIWFMLEAGLALALLIFIVWWTLPKNKK